MRSHFLFASMVVWPACAAPKAPVPSQVVIVAQGATPVPSSTMAAQKSLLAAPGAALRLAQDGAVRELVTTQALTPDTPEAMARAALAAQGAALGELPLLTLDRVQREALATHVRFSESINGFVVAGHSIDVHIADDGSGPELRRIASTLAASPTRMPPPPSDPTLQSLGMAKLRAQQIVAEPAQNWRAEALTMVEDFGAGPRLINQVLLHGDTSELEVDLDAYSNELLGRSDHTQSGNVSALIYPINVSRSDRAQIPLEYLSVGDSVSDVNGNFAGNSVSLNGLRGPYFSVLNGADPVIDYSGDGTIALALTDPHLGELSAFHFLAVSHDFSEPPSTFTISTTCPRPRPFTTAAVCTTRTPPATIKSSLAMPAGYSITRNRPTTSCTSTHTS